MTADIQTFPRGIRVTPWPHEDDPALTNITRIIQSEGLKPETWANGPGTHYSSHEHAFHKVLYVAQGSIVFKLIDGTTIPLKRGARLDLPPHIQHRADVGSNGVTCVEGHRK